jgi:hypothetical protein
MTKNSLTSESDNNLGSLIHLNDQLANQAITRGPKKMHQGAAKQENGFMAVFVQYG